MDRLDAQMFRVLTHALMIPLLAALTAAIPLAAAAAESGTAPHDLRCEYLTDPLKLFVTVPPNSQATVHIPTTRPASLTEGGNPIGTVEGVIPLEPAAGHAVMKVAAGRYAFACLMK